MDDHKVLFEKQGHAWSLDKLEELVDQGIHFFSGKYTSQGPGLKGVEKRSGKVYKFKGQFTMFAFFPKDCSMSASS